MPRERMKRNLALETQLVCEIGTGPAVARLAHGAIDTLQLKLVKRHSGSGPYAVSWTLSRLPTALAARSSV